MTRTNWKLAGIGIVGALTIGTGTTWALLVSNLDAIGGEAVSRSANTQWQMAVMLAIAALTLGLFAGAMGQPRLARLLGWSLLLVTGMSMLGWYDAFKSFVSGNLELDIPYWLSVAVALGCSITVLGTSNRKSSS